GRRCRTGPARRRFARQEGGRPDRAGHGREEAAATPGSAGAASRGPTRVAAGAPDPAGSPFDSGSARDRVAARSTPPADPAGPARAAGRRSAFSTRGRVWGAGSTEHGVRDRERAGREHPAALSGPAPPAGATGSTGTAEPTGDTDRTSAPLLTDRRRAEPAG